jgi:hypothetical protein
MPTPLFKKQARKRFKWRVKEKLKRMLRNLAFTPSSHNLKGQED